MIALAWYILIIPFFNPDFFTSVIVQSTDPVSIGYTLIRGATAIGSRMITIMLLPLMALMTMFFSLRVEKVVEEFIDLGFKAIVVSGKSDIFSSQFVGRYIDKNLLKEIEKKDICPCGEKGEFHTLVIDGPIFKNKISINKTRPVLKDGFWSYWFLDIQDYQVVAKN